MRYNDEVTTITLLTSGSCNLNCNFCFLHKNIAFQKMDKIVQAAWKNKEYLTTIQKVLEKLKIDYNNIRDITLWGGEPLLNLTNFNNNIQDLFLTFPNLSRFSTSSNFNINIQDLIKLLQNIDLYTNNEIAFGLQLSIDNIFYNEGHNIPFYVYKEKFKELLENTYNIKFQKIKLIINFRCTITEEKYLNLFQDKQLLTDYLDYINDLMEYIYSFNINQNIIISSTAFPIAVYPTHCTSAQGIQLSNNLRIWDNIKNSYHLANGLYDEILPRMKTLSEIEIGPNFECGNLLHDLMILPDGTITNCLNAYMSGYSEYEKELQNENDIKGLSELELEKAYCFNPLSMTEKEIYKQVWYIQNCLKNNISTYLYFALKMCEELIDVNQISNIYDGNTNLLFKHIMLIEKNLACMYYNMHETQLPFLNSPSIFRKYLNGAVEYYSNNNNNNNNNRG